MQSHRNSSWSQGLHAVAPERAAWSAVDGGLTAVMDKLLTLEIGQDILLQTLKSTLSHVQGHTAFADQQQHQPRQQQQDSHTQLWMQSQAPSSHTHSPEVNAVLPDGPALTADGLDVYVASAEPEHTAQVPMVDGMEESAKPRPGTPGMHERFKTRRQMTTSHQATLSEKEFEAILSFASKRQHLHDLHEGRRTVSIFALGSKLKGGIVCYNRKWLAQIIDLVAAVMIVLNAIFMGVLMDRVDADEGPWIYIKCGFATIFWTELFLKVGLFGWRNQYCGNGSVSNIFDSCLILMDTVDIGLSFFKGRVPGGNSILLLRTLRLMRLMRLMRLFRLFKASIFTDLFAMVHALRSGVSTLLWSIAFFFSFVYVASLIFRATFGPSTDEGEIVDPQTVGFYFQNVPRSMLTTYRCSFGDCSTTGGTPILESTYQELGPVASVALSGLIFVASVGLFNIISAVFLERIVSYAATKSLEKQKWRLHDKRLWHESASRFVDIQLQLHDQVAYNEVGEIEMGSLKLDPELFKQSGYQQLTTLSGTTLAQKSFSREVLDLSVYACSEAREILSDLDIDTQDCLGLSETLDKNKNGRIDIMELISGLSRLRGPARRSDIVAVDLAVQSMQARMDEIWLNYKKQQRTPTVRFGGVTQTSACPHQVDQI